MSENKMKEVAKLLGVEFNKQFRIKEYGERFYKINEKGLEGEGGLICEYTLVELLLGDSHIKKPILTDKEKSYLEGVLRPFKDGVMYIEKRRCGTKKVFIKIGMEHDEFNLPNFTNGTMYKGMQLNKEYPLEELELFKNE